MRATLQGLISYLGLSSRETAQLLGIGEAALSRKLAGKERYDVREDEVATLARLAETVDQMVERASAQISAFIRQHVERQSATDEQGETIDVPLLIYRHDADMPPWAGLPFASVHRVAVARISRKIEPHGRLVLFDRASYNEWRGLRDDTQDVRAEWAGFQPQKRFAFKLDTKAIGWTALGFCGTEPVMRDRGITSLREDE